MFRCLYFLPLFCVFIDCYQTYHHYSLIKLLPENRVQLELLYNISHNEDITLKYGLDFWSPPISLDRSVDILLPPYSRDAVQHLFNLLQIKFEIAIPDIQKLIDNEKFVNTMYYPNDRRQGYFYAYQRLKEIHGYMDELAEQYHPRAQIEIIGKSFEGRDMKVIHIGDKDNTTKPRVWIDANIHAREWITSATAMYIVVKLVTDIEDPIVAKLLEKYSFTILPVANPDGYEYSHTFARMWRKTRSQRGIFRWLCAGVDPNRNWNFHWREDGSSALHCSEMFAGPYPFSEPETKAMSHYILANKGKWASYLSLHSYSQLILTPWGFSKELPEGYSDLMHVANSAVNALKMRGQDYKAGSSSNLLYKASGGSEDWAMGVAGIKYSYCIELRDQGKYGFLIPPEQILESGEETFEALQAMLNTLKM